MRVAQRGPDFDSQIFKRAFKDNEFLDMTDEMAERYLNEGFSGGEKSAMRFYR